MTSDVGSSHLLEFAFWALWVTAVLRNTLSKDPKVVVSNVRATALAEKQAGRGAAAVGASGGGAGALRGGGAAAGAGGEAGVVAGAAAGEGGAGGEAGAVASMAAGEGGAGGEAGVAATPPVSSIRRSHGKLLHDIVRDFIHEQLKSDETTGSVLLNDLQQTLLDSSPPRVQEQIRRIYKWCSHKKHKCSSKKLLQDHNFEARWRSFEPKPEVCHASIRGRAILSTSKTASPEPLTSTSMLALATCVLPFQATPQCFPQVFIRICPVLGTLLLPCSVGLRPPLWRPPFVRNRSIVPYPVRRVIRAPDR